MKSGLKKWLGMASLVAALALAVTPTVRAQEHNAAPAEGTKAVQAAAEGHATEAAAEGHAGEHKGSLLDLDPGQFVFTIAVFVVLLVILRATAWKPILTGLKSREQSIREGIEAAAKAREEAAKTAKELEAKIAAAQKEASQQIAQAKADATKLAEGIRKQAEADANALRDRTMKELEAAKQQAISDINTHAAELGTAIAKKILQRNVTAEDHGRLVSESLQQLNGVGNLN